MDARLKPFVLFLFAMAVAALAPLHARAQEEPNTVLEIEMAGQGKTLNPIRPLDLRPNTSTEFGIALKNAHTEKLNDVIAKLVQVVGPKKYRALAFAKLAALNPGDKALLVFDEIKGLKKGSLVGESPYKVQLHIDAAPTIGFDPIKVDLSMSIGEPAKYIIEDAEIKTKAGQRRFKVEVTDDIKSPGPHRCPVQLVLGPEFVPTKRGSYNRTFDFAKQKDDLFADGLTFAGKFTSGRIFLRVDGYERAFIYDVSSVGEGKVTPRSFATKIGASIPIERYRRPDAKFVVPLELDGPLSDDYRVELALDRTGEKERFSEVRKLVGLRQKQITLTVSPTKNLVVQTEVSDWQPQFDTAGIYGDLWLRVRIFNVARKDADTGKPPYQERLDVPTEPLPGLARMELEGKILYVKVTQDDSPAENIDFPNLSKEKEWPLGKKVPLIVSIKRREADQAPIDKVYLLRGKAPKEKDEIKIEDVIDKDEAPDGKSEWTFMVPPPTKAEPMLVTVQFTTKTGVKSAKSETIYFRDTKGVVSKTLATIKGIVKHGENFQPGKEVVLSDGKKKEMTKTDDKGEFVFKDVPPGSYVVSSTFSDVATFTGEKKVDVKEGAKTIDIGDLPVLQKN